MINPSVQIQRYKRYKSNGKNNIYNDDHVQRFLPLSMIDLNTEIDELLNLRIQNQDILLDTFLYNNCISTWSGLNIKIMYD